MFRDSARHFLAARDFIGLDPESVRAVDGIPYDAGVRAVRHAAQLVWREAVSLLSSYRTAV